jgi:hypothetical protein
MNRCLYPAVVTLALWTAFAPLEADAQELARRVDDSSAGPRRFLLLLPQDPQTSRQRPAGVRFARLTADGDWAGSAGALGAQSTRPARSRGLTRKVFGALVGTAGGFFGGGYLGATIEGDRCHCDDPGLKGALIGAPVGAVAGGVLGWRYLF